MRDTRSRITSTNDSAMMMVAAVVAVVEGFVLTLPSYTPPSVAGIAAAVAVAAVAAAAATTNLAVPPPFTRAGLSSLVSLISYGSLRTTQPSRSSTCSDVHFLGRYTPRSLLRLSRAVTLTQPSGRLSGKRVRSRHTCGFVGTSFVVIASYAAR